MAMVYAAAAVTVIRQRSSRLLLVALVASAINSGCRDPELPQLNAGIPLRSECPASASDEYYFPEASIIPWSNSWDRKEREILSSNLRAAKETSLSCGLQPDEGYRVQWGGGYQEPLIVASVARNGSDWTVTATEFARIQPYLVTSSSSRALQPKAAATIAAALNDATFWTTRVMDTTQGEGTIWLIEARQGRYRAVIRVQPETAFARAAQLIVRLSGMQVPEKMKVSD